MGAEKSNETGQFLGHETVQEIFEELLSNTRYDGETKAKYRERVGIAMRFQEQQAGELLARAREAYGRA